jgi:hypothetical protein
MTIENIMISGKWEKATPKAIDNLKAYFKHSSMVLAGEAEEKVKDLLKQKYPVVIDLRFPKTLTEEIDKIREQRNYNFLSLMKELLATKIDFIAGTGVLKDVRMVNAKGMFNDRWLNWGCGADSQEYDKYAEFAKIVPFYLYVWVKEKNQFYIHKIKDPKVAKYEKLTNKDGRTAYDIPPSEIIKA